VGLLLPLGLLVFGSELRVPTNSRPCTTATTEHVAEHVVHATEHLLHALHQGHPVRAWSSVATSRGIRCSLLSTGRRDVVGMTAVLGVTELPLSVFATEGGLCITERSGEASRDPVVHCVRIAHYT